MMAEEHSAALESQRIIPGLKMGPIDGMNLSTNKFIRFTDIKKIEF